MPHHYVSVQIHIPSNSDWNVFVCDAKTRIRGPHRMRFPRWESVRGAHRSRKKQHENLFYIIQSIAFKCHVISNNNRKIDVEKLNAKEQKPPTKPFPRPDKREFIEFRVVAKTRKRDVVQVQRLCVCVCTCIRSYVCFVRHTINHQIRDEQTNDE